MVCRTNLFDITNFGTVFTSSAAALLVESTFSSSCVRDNLLLVDLFELLLSYISYSLIKPPAVPRSRKKPRKVS